MCGIAAYLGSQQAYPAVLMVLRRLEHLGRHSAGIALVRSDGIHVHRAIGGCDQLAHHLQQVDIASTCAIAHNRGATIGPATLENAHPHGSASGRIVMVHSGEVANHVALRHELESRGVVFTSSTDSEVIPHLIDQSYVRGSSPEAAHQSVRTTLQRLEGGNAFAAVFADHPGRIFVARHGSPVIVGRSGGSGADAPIAWWLASEVGSLKGHAQQVATIPDGHTADVSQEGLSVQSPSSAEVILAFRQTGIAVGLHACHMFARRIRQAVWRRSQPRPTPSASDRR